MPPRMPLVATKKIPSSFAYPANYQAENKLEWDIKLGDVFVELLLRIAGTMTIGVADCTGLQNAAILGLIRELYVEADYKDIDLAAAIRSYDHRGVNDGAAGRTAAMAGRMLALESLIDVGTPIIQTDPGLTVAAQPFVLTVPIRFWRPRAKKPFETLIDSRQLTKSGGFKLKLTLGILDTTAAGADTDVLVTDATTTVVTALTAELSARVLKNAAPGRLYDIRRVTSKQVALVTDNALELPLKEKGHYTRLMLLVTDDDVPSDARVTNLRVNVDDWKDVVDTTWLASKDDAKQRYALAAGLTGLNVIDFAGKLQTGEAHNLNLIALVPAGAVVAADRLFCAAEEVVPNPGRGQGSAVETRGEVNSGRRGRGRSR